MEGARAGCGAEPCGAAVVPSPSDWDNPTGGGTAATLGARAETSRLGLTCQRKQTGEVTLPIVTKAPSVSSVNHFEPAAALL